MNSLTLPLILLLGFFFMPLPIPVLQKYVLLKIKRGQYSFTLNCSISGSLNSGNLIPAVASHTKCKMESFELWKVNGTTGVQEGSTLDCVSFTPS